MRIFWPENGFQSCHKCGAGAVYYNGGGADHAVSDWEGIAAELRPGIRQSADYSDSEAGAYAAASDEAAPRFCGTPATSA